MRTGRCAGPARRAVGGFTLIELMVVVAILLMAMGIMTPTLLEFFKNQKLKNVRAHFSSAFNMARLTAITEGTPTRVVFFREGVRVYHVRKKAFRRDEEFNPDAAPGSVRGISFELRFANLRNSDLVPYREWEQTQPDLNAPPTSPGAGQCSVEDMGQASPRIGPVSIEFQRDGTVTWLRGENISSVLFNKEPAEDADVIVRQEENPEALYIDVRRTGQVRAKFDRPAEPAEARRR